MSWWFCGLKNKEKKSKKTLLVQISKQELIHKYKEKTLEKIKNNPNQYYYFWFLLSKEEYWNARMSTELKNILIVEMRHVKIINVLYNNYYSWVSIEIEL